MNARPASRRKEQLNGMPTPHSIDPASPLARLGLTPDQVRALASRHATVRAEAPHAIRRALSAKSRRHEAERRAARQAAGLTVAGKPRLRRAWPDLAAMERPLYHRLYMRIWRAARRPAPAYNARPPRP